VDHQKQTVKKQKKIETQEEKNSKLRVYFMLSYCNAIFEMLLEMLFEICFFEFS